jgi:hypothetical protein
MMDNIPELFLSLSELLYFEDTAHLAVTSKATLDALEMVNRTLLSSYAGLELFHWRTFKAAAFSQMRESIDPHLLLHVHWCAGRRKKSSLTVPMPVILDTSRTFYIQLWVSAGSTINGAPYVGVVDAEKAPTDSRAWLDDLSRPRRSSQAFGISCNPYTGRLHGTYTAEFAQKVLGSDSCSEPTSSKSCCSQIDWESGEEATWGRQRASIEIGMLISNGTLEFIRSGPTGWERSGVVHDSLPAKVVCCSFLYEFVGEAIVSFENLYINELPMVCTEPKKSQNRALQWSAWPMVN